MLSLIFSVAAIAGPIEPTENGKFQTEICEINGNQLGKNKVFNFKTGNGQHITGGRTNDAQCVVTKISGVESGDTVILEVEKNNGGTHRGSYTLPKRRGHDRRRMSLSGYCADEDHREFKVAREFAYSSSGLNMSDPDSVNWALRYIETHACGTIAEYQARFTALYEFGYSSNYLNLSSSQARAFALGQVEDVTVEETTLKVQDFAIVKDFAYNSYGLNLTSNQANAIALNWIDSGRCESARYVQLEIIPTFTREYEFAYSSSGLNMSSNGAREYALSKLNRVTGCVDILSLR
jgi:hypothetical protein